jgi:hypothetical protein
MSDRLLFPLLGVLALTMIGLALVWPQGLGARSPGPFGHLPVQQLKPAAAPPASKTAPPPAVLGLAPPPAPASASPSSAP